MDPIVVRWFRTAAVGGAMLLFLIAGCARATEPEGAGGGTTQQPTTEATPEPTAEPTEMPATEDQSALQTTVVEGIGAVLTTSDGFVLYRFAPEEDGTIACEGDCAEAWPPLLAEDGQPPAAPGGIADELGTIERPDGTVQVTFDDWPLYLFAGDAEPGQATGHELNDVWFAVETSGALEGRGGSDY